VVVVVVGPKFGTTLGTVVGRMGRVVGDVVDVVDVVVVGSELAGRGLQDVELFQQM